MQLSAVGIGAEFLFMPRVLGTLAIGCSSPRSVGSQFGDPGYRRVHKHPGASSACACPWLPKDICLSLLSDHQCVLRSSARHVFLSLGQRVEDGGVCTLLHPY